MPFSASLVSFSQPSLAFSVVFAASSLIFLRVSFPLAGAKRMPRMKPAAAPITNETATSRALDPLLLSPISFLLSFFHSPPQKADDREEDRPISGGRPDEPGRHEPGHLGQVQGDPLGGFQGLAGALQP